MRGRPPKSLSLVAIEGDVSQRGANKHRAQVNAQWNSSRGVPEMPACLRFRKIAPPVEASAEVKAEIEQRNVEIRRKLKTAREHWTYLAEGLSAEGMLSTIDEGMLTSAAMAYAEMIEGGLYGRPSAFLAASQRYMQFSDRMGLSESARARLSRVKPPEQDPLRSAIGPVPKTA